MDTPSPPPWPPDPRERRICEALARLGPGPLAYFVDACRHVREPTQYESTTHIVGHLLREIQGSLLDLLVPVELFGQRDVPDRHKTKVIAALEFLEIDANGPVAEAWLGRLKGEAAYHTRAHRTALDRPRPVDAAFISLWSADVWLLDEILQRLEAKYLDLHRRIDEIVSAPGVPDNNLRRRAKEHIPNNGVSHGYLFSKLADGERWEWIEPLLKSGWFASPPAAIRNEVEGSVTLPAWPASKFLARVAVVPEAQRDVFAAVCAVPDVDNATICRDLVVALTALPSALSHQQASRVRGWLRLDHVELLADDVAAFACKLGGDGLMDEALMLARSVLEVLADPKTASYHGIEGYKPRPEAVALVPHWNYERLLDKHFLPLADIAARRFLDLLIDLLEEALRLSSPESDRPETGNFSFFWRPAIEDHVQNLDRSIAGALISAVRDLTLRLGTDAPTIRELVVALEARRWPVFRRLAGC